MYAYSFQYECSLSKYMTQACDITFDYSVDGRNFVVPAYARKYFGATKGTWTVSA